MICTKCGKPMRRTRRWYLLRRLHRAVGYVIVYACRCGHIGRSRMVWKGPTPDSR
jgi:hypothetical protein